MEKLLLVAVGAALTGAEAAKGSGFPLSSDEAWQMAFVLIAALFTSASNAASKRRDGRAVRLTPFLGDVGLGVAAGVCAPLLITAVAEHFGVESDWRASVGLSILGAYVGRDLLRALYTAGLWVAEGAARLKGIQISFKQPPGGKHEP